MSRLAPLVLVAMLLAAPAAQADDSVSQDASRHFQRGVDLYSEGDFRAALVEFKKAYTLLPRATVLYDIGQTEYQLKEYAHALRTLERFLFETGAGAPHRAEVEETVEVLRGRVGHIALTGDPEAIAGCGIAVDDQPAGTAPLADSILVSIGRRTVALTCAGRPRVAREVDVAAGETVGIALTPPPVDATPPVSTDTPVQRPSGRRRAVISWIVTGTLAAAAAGFYTSALLSSGSLGDLKRSYPVTAQRLDQRAHLTSTLALTGDILAAATAVAAGVSTYFSVTRSRDERAPRVGLAWTGTGLALSGKF